MRYVLGIDQGGSKTHAVIADRRAGFWEWEKVMVHAIPAPAWTMQCRQLSRLPDQALSECGLQKEDVTAVLGGLTGIDWDYEAELLENEIRKYFPRADVKIVNDCIIAMRCSH